MKLVRINILVEGKTEKVFVNNVLQKLISYVDDKTVIWAPRRITTAMDKASGKVFKGGGISLEKLKNEFVNWFKQEADKNVIFTSLFDFYKFPRKITFQTTSPLRKVQILEAWLSDFILENVRNKKVNFVPYIQLFELETFMLADCDALITAFENELNWNECKKLLEILKNKSPEEINETPQGHPSARIKRVIPSYDKVSDFSMFLKFANFEKFINSMPHFKNWIDELKLKILKL